MGNLVFGQQALPTLAIESDTARYEVRRVFCVGRNYAEHALEMGNAVDRSAPFYFTKSPFAVLTDGADFPYPPETQDCHHEMEFVVALSDDGIFGYACGLDMTRRDLQAIAKEKRRPWDVAKDFEHSAILGALTPAERFGDIGHQAISLCVNGETRQNVTLDTMIHSVPAILQDLAKFYTLGAGDIIMTGTPAGVGPVQRGDTMVGSIDGLSDLVVNVV